MKKMGSKKNGSVREGQKERECIRKTGHSRNGLCRQKEREERKSNSVPYDHNLGSKLASPFALSASAPTRSSSCLILWPQM